MAARLPTTPPAMGTTLLEEAGLAFVPLSEESGAKLVTATSDECEDEDSAINCVCCEEGGSEIVIGPT